MESNIKMKQMLVDFFTAGVPQNPLIYPSSPGRPTQDDGR